MDKNHDNNTFSNYALPVNTETSVKKDKTKGFPRPKGRNNVETQIKFLGDTFENFNVYNVLSRCVCFVLFSSETGLDGR